MSILSVTDSLTSHYCCYNFIDSALLKPVDTLTVADDDVGELVDNSLKCGQDFKKKYFVAEI